MRQKSKEFYWTVTRALGLSFLHGGSDVKWKVPDTQFKATAEKISRSFHEYRMPFKIDLNRLIHLTAAYSLAPCEETARKIIAILVKSDDKIQIARWIARVNDLSAYSTDFLVELNSAFPLPFLVLGGGPDYLYPLWQNLDSECGPLNPFAFSFERDHLLPAASQSCDVVYIHRALDEIHNERAAQRLCSEAARVVTKDGAIILTSSYLDAFALSELAARCEIDVISTDRHRIVSRFNYIPRIAMNAECRSFVFGVPKEK